MMLSESQERMLMVLKPAEEMAAAIFEKWELDFAVIGEVTDTRHMVLEFGGEVVCDIPLGPLRPMRPNTTGLTFRRTIIPLGPASSRCNSVPIPAMSVAT